ncbi:MAG: hypothetical protein C0392_12245 [Syntrophus sp. (in: bacteria)]|nr:hypothetical protein [Syntrophus sp. (in: bacteria)]
MKKDYYLCLGDDKREYFALPPQWKVSHFKEAEKREKIHSVKEMAEEALSMPVNTRPLKNLISGAKSIAIIVDDGTRPTPILEILKVLLPQVEEGGFSPQDIVIVVALGTHANMTRENLEARMGKDVVSRYRIVQHDPWQSDLVPVHVLGEEKIVKINPEVARADIKIGISSILPHPMAGYGGGPKIIMPGVSDYEYIRDHHMRLTIHPHAVAGYTRDNPFHEVCMRVARTVGLDFSINCVYNEQGEIIRIIGGSLDGAFTAAVELCFERLGAQFEEKVDITITSTYPHTHAVQFAKGLSAPTVVTKETGAILIAVPTIAPLPEEFINSFTIVKEKSHNKSFEYVMDAMSQGMLFQPDKTVEFNMAMSCIILRPAIRTILVSPMITEREASIMGLEHVSSIEEGLKVLEASYPEAKVAIFPSGGLIIPVVPWKR